MVMNKYDGRHAAAHESAKASGHVMNSTVNKSGANLTNNNNRSKVGGQTQRTGYTANGPGSATGRSQSKIAQGLTNSVLSHNSSYAKGTLNNKSTVSNLTSKILGEHQDKENR